MGRRITSRILILGAFLASVMLAVNVAAQTGTPTAPHSATTGTSPQTPTTKSAPSHATQQNPACARIINECKKLGFIQGEWKQDNGLWKDCFDPVVQGGGATRDGKPITVPVNASDVEACRTARGHRK